jgi:hypothetical protein
MVGGEAARVEEVSPSTPWRAKAGRVQGGTIGPSTPWRAKAGRVQGGTIGPSIPHTARGGGSRFS